MLRDRDRSRDRGPRGRLLTNANSSLQTRTSHALLTILRNDRRLRHAALLSLVPLLFFLLLTAGYNKGQIPRVRSEDPNAILYSVIVPTYKEVSNIPLLVEQVFAAVPDPERTEIVIVDDDSRDGTEEAVEALRAGTYTHDDEEGHTHEDGNDKAGYPNLVLVVRTGLTKAEKGLSSAVLRGFAEARGSKFVVMDADLQHPPSSVPDLFSALSSSTPFALGTRYGGGGAVDKDWPLLRRIISAGARSLARPLTKATDPMSGFFGITRDLYASASPVNPVGFKIALELLLKTGIKSTVADPTMPHLAEVPYAFAKRARGASKLSSKTIIKYVLHLGALYRWRVGMVGVFGLEILLIAGSYLALVFFRGRRRVVARTAAGGGEEERERAVGCLDAHQGVQGVIRVRLMVRERSREEA
ncbi:Dolichol-phosphate mannosyltransferase subunit 1 [Mycena sanguinolenta]|uniref:Dolichol-phosphate mannosyltransferase subunit 1 n=1 Tax=Mycena sanguinolenta TaxID=230812 RepID=A0A8H7CF69_9AGAR|nr:Dolichol-phosphate mannosyltransferase subunit 1 [Mycena sanguinolenta]